MTRLLTAALGIVLILAVTLQGPPWALGLLVALAAAFGMDEFLHMASVRGMRSPGRWAIVPGVGVTLGFAFSLEWAVALLVFDLILLSAVSMAGGKGTGHLEYLAFGLTGTVYTCLLPGFLLMPAREGLWVLLGTVWAGDTAAYYGGRGLGRHRLAPVLSPNKTVEGAVAGALGSLLVGGVLGRWLLGASVPFLIVLCLVTGVAGQLGDLAESSMKRTAGIKDSANRLPGHGGVLDRIDSLLFAAPVFHFLTVWLA